MPANWDTFGTVVSSKGLVESNCLTGACYEIVKNLNGEIMTKKEMNTKEEPQSEDSGLTEDKVIELINEYMAEKEETIVEEITGKVESQLESMVEAKVQELIDDEEEVPPAEDGETKAQEDEEDEDASTEEEDKEDETKSLSPEMITEVINKGIADALGDDFADKVASKMFGDLDKSRSTNGSKFDEYQKSLPTKEPEEVATEKSCYSSKEAAEFLLRKQKSANPLMAAVTKNLE